MNDFVNPQHRGVSLPFGYKDLIEVLEAKKGSGSVTMRSPLKVERIHSGGLAHVENYLRRFLMAHLPRASLTILTCCDGVAFNLLNGKGGPYAVFCLPNPPTAREKIVREIFEDFGFAPTLDELTRGAVQRVIRFDLSDVFPYALRIITEILGQAYGISEKDGLSFLFRG